MTNIKEILAQFRKDMSAARKMTGADKIMAEMDARRARADAEKLDAEIEALKSICEDDEISPRLAQLAKVERVTVEQLEDGIQAGQWMARDYRRTPLVIRDTAEDALQEGVNMAIDARYSVNGFC